MAEPKDPPHSVGLLRMIEYSPPGAQQVSPVATMLLILARRELIPQLPSCDGVVVPFRRQEFR
jgi:hypothetical protein